MASRLAYYALGVALLAVLVAAAYMLAGGGAGGQQPREIVVYVYEDFMAWGEDPKLFDKLVQEFGNETGVRVRLVKFDGAAAMVAQVAAEAQAGKPTAHVVVGVDSVSVHRLKAAGLLDCYLSPEAPRELAEALDEDACVTPVDYGVIALVYDPGRLSEEQLAMVRDGVTLEELVELAPVLIVEDPTKSSTGQNFLLYTIAVSRLEGVDWREVWRRLLENGVMVAKSWGDAYDEFLREGSPRAIVVSYGTDPAYSAWYNAKEGAGREPSVGAVFLALGNGSRVAWLQVEGAAVVKGAPPEARRFVDWLLSRRVQELIPGSQWMFPARSDVELPWYYQYALKAGDAEILGNRVVGPGEVAEKLEGWLEEWLRLAGG